MKQVLKNSLGFDVPVLFYESAEECDRAAGKVGATVDECNANLYYRGAAPESRSVVCEAVEAITGIKRLTSPVMTKVKGEDGVEREEQEKDKDGNPILEYSQTEQKYIDFALAQANTSAQALQPQVTAYIASRKNPDGTPFLIAVDIKTKERKAPQPKALAEKWITFGKNAIAQGKAASVAKDAKKKVGLDLSEADLNDPTKVGGAIKAVIEYNAKQAESQFA